MIEFRPLPAWPYPSTPQRFSSYQFKAGWEATMRLLRGEVQKLGGEGALIGIVADGSVTRRDGMLRHDVRPSHPGVELSFTATALPHEPRLVYATDAYAFWQHNVRAIALGLEALRAVDRYGVTRRGEQYAGFAALAAGGPDPARGEQLVRAAGGIREALFRHHPDHGGVARDFADVQAYREKVGG